jgi:hypothetical protein
VFQSLAARVLCCFFTCASFSWLQLASR